MIEIRRCGAGDGQLAFPLHLPLRSLQEWKKQLVFFSAVLKAGSKRLLLHLQNLWQVCRHECSLCGPLDGDGL